MTEWKECLISDLGTVVGGATPSTKDPSNYKDGKISWITPKDLSNYEDRYISRGERNITEKGLNSCSAQLMPEHSVLFTSRAPIGYVAIAANEVCTNQGFKSVVPNENTDYLFLYYLLKHNKSKIEGLGSGTTFKEVSGSTMRGIKVKVPTTLSAQKAIGEFLNSIDCKIEGNRRINKNLEQQAQELFKAWFVTFEAFGGEMPSSWSVAKLGDIAAIKTNSFSPTKNPTVMLEHYSIPAFDEQKYPVFELASNVKSNKYILTDNSVMISKLNPNTKRVWRPMCISEFAVSSTEFIIFEANDPTYRDFVFSVIDSAAFSDWMCAHTTGSTNSRQRTTPSTTLEFQIVLPNQEVVSDFCKVVTPMYDMIAQNTCENRKLAAFRDSLLPKLMSGELDVSEIAL